MSAETPFLRLPSVWRPTVLMYVLWPFRPIISQHWTCLSRECRGSWTKCFDVVYAGLRLRTPSGRSPTRSRGTGAHLTRGRAAHLTRHRGNQNPDQVNSSRAQAALSERREQVACGPRRSLADTFRRGLQPPRAAAHGRNFERRTHLGEPAPKSRLTVWSGPRYAASGTGSATRAPCSSRISQVCGGNSTSRSPFRQASSASWYAARQARSSATLWRQLT